VFKLDSRLEITTVSKCVIDCSYCPQQVFQEAYHGCRTLSLENFKKALLSVPKNVTIHFSGFSEPFLNPECIDMIEYAHSTGYKIVIFSTLVGLKSENVKRLQICNPEEFVLHLPDNKDNAKIPITETYKDTLVTALKLLRVSYFSVMNDLFISNERAGLCLNIPKRRVHGWFYCTKLVSPQFVMLPNCDVVLCCMDFGLKHRLGNLLEQSFMDIVNSKEYKRVRDGRFKTRVGIICRKCMWAVPLYRWYGRRVLVLFKILPST